MVVDGVAFVYRGVCILTVMKKSEMCLLLMLRAFRVLIDDWSDGPILRYGDREAYHFTMCCGDD